MLVGHSLFFRRFFHTYASSVQGGAIPDGASTDTDAGAGAVVATASGTSSGNNLITELGQHKLPNCGTVAVLFDFGADGCGEQPAIVDAQLVFGTTLDRRRASTSAPEARA